MQSRSMEHSLSLAISFCSILMIFYLLAKVRIIIENTPLFDIFLPQNIKIYSLLGQNGVEKMKSGSDISMKPDADMVMRKLAQITRF